MKGFESITQTSPTPTEGATIVVRYLGYTCTHCVEHIRYLSEQTKVLAQHGVKVILLSEDDEHVTDKLFEKLKLNRTVFVAQPDPELVLAKDLKAVRMENDTLFDLHAVLVIKNSRVEFSAYSESPFMDVERIVAAAIQTKETDLVQAGAMSVVDAYMTKTTTVNIVASAQQGIENPVDLDFNRSPLHPNDLWVVLASNDGNKMAIVHNAGKQNQVVRVKKDYRASHFMWRTMAIAMGTNGTFGTMQSGRPGNGNPQYLFMGPTLWSADTAVFASRNQFTFGNVLASHLDMLHQSPNGLGMAHEKDNVYWVSDELRQNIFRYDFQNPHEVGGTDHRDGIVRRYSDVIVTSSSDPDQPAHIDISGKWLYFIDAGSKRVKRMDITSGALRGNIPPEYGGEENLASYTNWQGATVETIEASSAIQSPVGLLCVGDYLLVGDSKTGFVFVFDMGANGILKGTIVTDAKKLYGLEWGPDNRLWFVDNASATVGRVEFGSELILQAKSYTQAVGKGSTIQMRVTNTSSQTVEVALGLEAENVRGEGPGGSFEDQVLGVGAGTTAVVEFTVTGMDTTKVGTVQLIDRISGLTSPDAVTHVIWNKTRRVVVQDATMETFNLYDAVASYALAPLTKKSVPYVYVESPLFVAFADSLPELRTVLWNGGSFGEVSAADDAILSSLVERNVDIFLTADDALVSRTDMDFSIQFFKNFGVEFRGPDNADELAGQRVFTPSATEPITAGLASIDCQLPRLDALRGGSYVANINFRTSGDSSVALLTRGSSVISAVRKKNGDYRSVILGLNLARILDVNLRDTLVARSLEWLEAAETKDSITTPPDTTSINDAEAPYPTLAVNQNPFYDNLTVTLHTKGAGTEQTDVALYAITGQRMIDIYSGIVEQQMNIPINTVSLPRGMYLLIYRSATQTKHLMLVKQ